MVPRYHATISTLTEEKRAAWLAAQRDREETARKALTEGVAALSQRQGWLQWLELAGRLPQYSVGNQLLLVHQLPDASAVMSADQWRQVGRWPKRGSTALRIWAPRRGRRAAAEPDDRTADDKAAAAEEPPEKGLEQQQRRVRFVLIPVFDVSQTEGSELPAQPTPVPPPEGCAPAGMWDALVDYASAAGYQVGVGSTGPADGVTNFRDHRITINPGGSELSRTLTLAHEIGHMSLHADQSGGLHRGRAEVQAESVAYLVASEYGLTEAAEWHFDYLAHWAAQVGGEAGDVISEEIRDSATGVMGAARPLLEHLLEAGVGHADPQAHVPAPPTVREVSR